MNLAAPAIRVEMPQRDLHAARPARVARAAAAQPRIPATRRAAVGCAWALAWTLAWGLAIQGYSHRAQAASARAAMERPVAQAASAPSRKRH